MHSDVLELVKWGNILATILPLFHSYSGPRHYNLPLGSLLWPPTRCSTSACAPWVYSWHNCRTILFKCSQIMSFLCWKSPVTFHCAQSSSLKDLMWSVRPSLLSVSQPDDSYCSPPGSLAPASLLLHVHANILLAFSPAVPSAWLSLPSDICMACSLTSFSFPFALGWNVQPSEALS